MEIDKTNWHLKLSIIIPVFNAELSIEELVKDLVALYGDKETEIILVNDGSSDHSDEICRRMVNQYVNLKYIQLRRNFGEHNAVICGLNFSEAQFAVIIDDDFQNPPSQIKILLEEIEKGYDVVYSKYHLKKHNLYRNLVSKLTNWTANMLMSKPTDLYLSSFKIIRREVIDEIVRYKGPFPYIDGLILRTTDSLTSVFVNHDSRHKGKSNYTFKKLFSLFMNMFLNFSVRPLRIFTISGMIIFLAGILLSIYFIILKLNSLEFPGWTSTVTFILLLSGFQIIFLGLIGEYLGKQYLDQNNTPQYVIRSKINSKDS